MKFISLNKITRIGLLMVVTLMSLPFSHVQAFNYGKIDSSQGVACNACHNGGIAPVVTLTGPTNVAVGAVARYTLTISGGQANQGGFNVSATDGTFSVVSPGSWLTNNQIHHYTPSTADAAGNISWEFDWQAPLTDGTYVIYGAGLSSNASGSATGDAAATTTLTITVGAGGGTPPPAETGESLYISSCQVCHGAAPGPKAGRTATQIQTAITDNIGGMGSLSGLTATQVQLIADFLGGGGSTPQAPVANTGGAYAAAVDTQILFDGTASSDADGTIVSYSWDFGDGATATGATPAHTYTAEGLYTVTLTVTDNSGMTGSATTTANVAAGTPPPPVYDGAALYSTYCAGCHSILATSTKAGRTAAQIQNAINANLGGMGAASLGLTTLIPAEVQAIADALGGGTPAPQAPVANPGSAYSGVVGSAVQFNGASSTDADGTITAYAWDFGDGSVATGATPTHTYATTGLFTVSLTVTDNDGMTGSASTTANIGSGTPPPPVLDGLALYGTNCSTCHGAAPGTKAGRSASQIQSAIDLVLSMSSLNTLTAAEVQAIADAIASGGGSPPASDGEGLYNSYCASCHGAGGEGGTEGAVTGESAGSISDAIDAESEMRYLSSLLSSDEIALIADYLNGGSGGGGTITVTKKSQYDTYCGACHGAEGRGGAEEDVRGESAGGISDAISAESEMNYLSSLSDTIIEAISDYLNGDDSGTIEIPAPSGGGGGGGTIDGLALYGTSCSGCHGAAPGAKAGRTAAQIQAAIDGNAGGMGGLSGLTAAEVQAIADAIGGGGTGGGGTGGGDEPGTITVTKKSQYDTYCGACHGAEGRGGAEGDVRGESAGGISDAISAESEMNYLGSLSDNIIQAISDYLNGDDSGTIEIPAPSGGGGGGGTIDGLALYGTSCSGCHGAAPGAKAGRTAAQIQTAIDGNAGGMGGLSGLTAAEVQAIADAIGGGGTGGGGTGGGGTTTPDGNQLYTNNCSGCHGNAPGEKAGRSAGQIQAAIDGNAGGMGGLSGLTAAEVQAIADAIAGGGGTGGGGTGGGGTTTPDGNQLYTDNCSTCHGGAPGAKAGRTAAQIQAAIDGNAGGMGSLSGLTAEEVLAISMAIGGGSAPAPTTPEGLYVTYCGACHGADGSGGTEEGVRGASADEIMSAIESESDMNYLSGLLADSSIESIADYLRNSRDERGDGQLGDGSASASGGGGCTVKSNAPFDPLLPLLLLLSGAYLTRRNVVR